MNIMGCNMTIKIAKNICLLLPLVLSFSIQAEQKYMNNHSLWHITKELKSLWGKEIDAVGALIDQPLIPFTSTTKDRYTSQPFVLNDGINISDLDVRLSNNGAGKVALISFSVSGKCIPLEEVKEHFPDMMLHFIPRAKLKGRTFGYVTTRDQNSLAWGFSFPALNRDCLSAITMTRYDF